MTTTAKVSMAIGRAELEWAKTLARREGKSLSAIVTESLAERRRLAALAEVVAWMAEAQAPLTDDEVNAAQRELAAERKPAKGAPGRTKKSRRSMPRRRG